MQKLGTIARIGVMALVAGSLFALAPAGARTNVAVQHLHFSYGPVHIRPGQNIIEFSDAQVPKPSEDGWIVGIRPNLHLVDGTIPRVDIIHLHHAVWLNLSAPDTTVPSLPERFFAAGEEKTGFRLPPGYGYRYRADDAWLLNYMIHDLVDTAFDVYVDYDIDFMPEAAGAAIGMRNARPLWLDVQNGSLYPVFDVHRNSGVNGRFTYPQMAGDPYGRRNPHPLNVWTVDRPGVLLATAGHLHPGGLHTDLWLDRLHSSAHLFRSVARYYEPAGPVSWDVSMTATKPDWAVRVRKGDKLRINVTYDSRTASWYEAMGIMVVWMADEGRGANPFTTRVDGPGVLTHGHLAENDNHGGEPTDMADPRLLPDGPAVSDVPIADYEYELGDLDMPASAPPVVKQGQSLRYVNEDAPASGYGVWHTVTACRLPCNASTGVAFPLANGEVEFDSGQLGNDGAPTSGKLTWKTPKNLPVGTYSFFCRVHPFMRGAFRVVP